MMHSSVLRAMLASGCTAEQIVAVAETLLAAADEHAAERREKDRIRKKAARDRKTSMISTVASADIRGHPRTSADMVLSETETPTISTVESDLSADIRGIPDDGGAPLSPNKRSPHTPLRINPLTPVTPNCPDGQSAPLGEFDELFDLTGFALPSSKPNPEPAPKAESVDLDQALAAYNAEAGRAGWPKAVKLTPPRRAKLRRAVLDCGGLDGWTGMLAGTRKSAFLRGENSRDWLPSLDFFLQPSSLIKVLEGQYDGGFQAPNYARPASRRSGADILVAAVADLARSDDDWGLARGGNPGTDLGDGFVVDLEPIGGNRNGARWS